MTTGDVMNADPGSEDMLNTVEISVIAVAGVIVIVILLLLICLLCMCKFILVMLHVTAGDLTRSGSGYGAVYLECM